MPEVDVKIPLVDLAAAHEAVEEEVQAGWERVLRDTSFVLGDDVAAFEQEFAEFSGAGHCVGVANGTDALEIGLRALGVGPGDEVVVPANTFIASVLAISRAGARPVLVDCNPETHLIDVDQTAAAITSRTKALMPVHLYGQMAPMSELAAIVGSTEIAIVEDAAQAQGAEQAGHRAGSVGTLAGTSFYPGKNLGAYGDAGAVLTSDETLDRRLRALRNYGSEVKYHHPETGFNSRLDTLQAVVLRAKLRQLDSANERRRAAAARYETLLGDLGSVGLPGTAPGNEHVWHLYVVTVPDRDAVVARLHDAGVMAGVHYPVPVHLQGAFAHLGHGAGDFTNTERAAERIVSLPMFPEITATQQERVAEALARAVS